MIVTSMRNQMILLVLKNITHIMCSKLIHDKKTHWIWHQQVSLALGRTHGSLALWKQPSVATIISLYSYKVIYGCFHGYLASHGILGVL